MSGFALEVQSPYSRLILNGKKSIETRSYPLPDDLRGARILLCESLPSEDGVSNLGDSIAASQDGLSLVGEMFISRFKEYETEAEWESDRGEHMVPKESMYEWAPTESGRRYGWIIDQVVPYEVALPVPAMRRRLELLHLTLSSSDSSKQKKTNALNRFRSIFEFDLASDATIISPVNLDPL